MIRGILVYIILAVFIIGMGYILHAEHPNHAQIGVAWILGLGLPLLPAYIATKENI